MPTPTSTLSRSAQRGTPAKTQSKTERPVPTAPKTPAKPAPQKAATAIKQPNPAPASTAKSKATGKSQKAKAQELERLHAADQARLEDVDGAFEADQEAKAPGETVAQIIMGTGKSGLVTPPEEFVAWAMMAAIVDPNPTVRLRITPEIAVRFLERTHINRSLWPGVVEWLVKQRKSGDWNDKNGDVIRFNTKGELIDGQHRLTMIAVSGMTTDCDVKFNVPDDAQATIDVGRKRSVSDQLQLMGEKHSTALSATIRWLFSMALDDTSYRLNTQETVRFLERNPDVRKSVAYVHNTYLPKGTISTLLAAVHYVGAACLDQPDTANRFVDVFRSGVPAYKNDPAHKLRENNLGLLMSKGATLTQRGHFDSLVYAWNLFREGKEAKRFVVPEKPKVEGFDSAMLGIEVGEPVNVFDVLKKVRAKAA